MRALDQLTQDESVQKFSWLPEALPAKVTLVFSCLDSFELPSFLPYRGNSIVKTLSVLDRAEIPAVINGILSFAHKQLGETTKAAVAVKKNAENPLYLSMLIQRLIMLDIEDFGIIAEYGNDMAAISRYLLETVSTSPETLPGMCRIIFEDAAERINKPLCQRAAALITVSRRGLRESDLEGIFASDGVRGNSLDLSRFIKYFRPYSVLRSDGRIDFIHRSIREGILESTDISRDNALIFSHLKAMDLGDAVRLSEIVYHAQRADEKRFLTAYIEEANSKDEVTKNNQ